ncbi:MAG: hypothetical protein AB7E72_05085 [Lysobacterales bacterium]
MNSVILVFGLAALPLALLAASNWRYAFLAAILAGFAQDPIRKVLAGQPITMVVFSAFVLMFALAGAIMKHGMITMRPMAGNSPRTHALLRLFVFYVLIQAVLALLRFQSVMIPAIGSLAYLLPIPALWMAYQFVRSSADVGRFLRVYAAIGVFMALSIFLGNAGFGSTLLEPIGGDRIIFDRVAGIVETNSGWFRSAEVAAWHSGAVACMAIVLSVAFGGALTRLLTPGVVLFCVYAAVLTGRRKVLAVAMLFCAIYYLGNYYFQKRSSRRGGVVIVLMVFLILAGALTMAPEASTWSPYLARSSTVFSDSWERFSGLGLGSIRDGLGAGGFFGMGTGAGAQGTQAFGAGGGVVVGGASEGGLGKITAELGLPGLLLAVASAWLVARQVRRAIGLAAAADPRLLKMCLGLLAFVAANVPVFIGASQIYGDPFVLIMLGSMLGFVLAVPRILRLREMHERQLAQVRSLNAGGVAMHQPAYPLDRRPPAV